MKQRVQAFRPGGSEVRQRSDEQTEERNETLLDGLNLANRAHLDVKYRKASFGTLREDTEMECERVVLATRSH